MVDYAGLASTAARLLKQFGGNATFTRQTGATFDPATGSYSGGSTTQFSSDAARFNYSSTEIDGENVQRDDLRLIIQVNGGEPLINDECTFDSDTYRVMNVTKLSPSGEGDSLVTVSYTHLTLPTICSV